MVYPPRPEYGLIAPLLRGVDGGLLARGGADVLTLSSPVPFGTETETDGATARLRLSLSAGDTVGLALDRGHATEPPRTWSRPSAASANIWLRSGCRRFAPRSS